MTLTVTVSFADHASDQQRQIALSFLNSVSGATEITGKPTYTFVISRQSKIERTQDALKEWAKEGFIRCDAISTRRGIAS